MTQTPLDIDALMEKIRAEASTRNSVVESLRPSVTPGKTRLPRPSVSMVGQFRCESPFHYSDFTQYDGGAFLDAVYQGLLGRDPDAEARQLYSSYLKRGGSKLSLLAEIRLSPEGLQRPVALTGMALILRRHRLFQKLGLLGRVLRRLCDPVDRLFLRNSGNQLSLDDLKAAERAQVQFQSQLVEKVERVLQQHTADQQHMEQSVNNLQRKFDQRVSGLTDEILALKASFERDAQGRMADIQRTVAELAEMVDQRATQSDLDAATSALKQQFTYLQRAITLSTDKLKSLAGTAPEQVEAAVSLQEDAVLDAYYVAFEDACRGTRREIKQGLTHYLPVFADLREQQSLANLPVVDLGCGRGEWLELMREQGWQGQGIDLNPVMVEVCGEFGLTAQCLDALTYLKSLPESSVAAITGFHIIEHLPFAVLHGLFTEATRVVKAGGVILFETPNPENVLVGSHTFYHDFSHRNPVTPSAITFMAQYFGFVEVEIIRSHPYPAEAKVPGNDPLTERVNGHLCGPQDYALLARKPLIDHVSRRPVQH